VQVMTRLEKETGKRLPLATLFEHPTVEALAAQLQLDSKFVAWNSLVPIKPHGHKTPLYIVHGAGLNVLIFNALSKNMDPDQPIYGLQAKGLDGVEEPLDTIEGMASHYLAAILAANPTGPYALAGYSFGGIIAYEMARQLLAMGKEVKFLGMFDTYAYQSISEYSWLRRVLTQSQEALLERLYLLVLLRKNPGATMKLKLNSLKQKLSQLHRTKKEIYEQKYGHPYQIGLAQQAAIQRYKLVPQPLKVHLFRNEERAFYVPDFEHLGWRPFALHGISRHDIPGNHNHIFAPPHDQQAARIIQEALNKC
jgi:thioesterase domain-containing protein